MRLGPLFVLQIPTAAERLVEAHHRDELIPLGLSQGVGGHMNYKAKEGLYWLSTGSRLKF